MDLPELLEIRRINQALPFADPIARVMFGDVVIKTIPWREHFKVLRRIKRDYKEHIMDTER